MKTQTTEALVEPARAHGTADPAQLGPTQRPKKTFPQPKAIDHHGPARVVAVCNQKGGVGKTTTTINLGAALADYGRRVLLVDFDPQGALSVGLHQTPRDTDTTIYNVLMDRGVHAKEAMVPTPIEGMDLLRSNIQLSAAELQLVTQVAREQALTRLIEPLVPEYDIILIDCQPSLGLLTVNALTAATGVLVPVECEYFSMLGVALLEETIATVQDRLNPSLEIEGLLATMYDGRTVHGREVLARLMERFGDQVFHTVIGRTIRFPETTVAGMPITSHDPSSPGAKAYRQLAREVLSRWEPASLRA